jgi:hypothetical protein
VINSANIPKYEMINIGGPNTRFGNTGLDDVRANFIQGGVFERLPVVTKWGSTSSGQKNVRESHFITYICIDKIDESKANSCLFQGDNRAAFLQRLQHPSH